MRHASLVLVFGDDLKDRRDAVERARDGGESLRDVLEDVGVLRALLRRAGGGSRGRSLRGLSMGGGVRGSAIGSRSVLGRVGRGSGVGGRVLAVHRKRHTSSKNTREQRVKADHVSKSYSCEAFHVTYVVSPPA